MAGRNDPDSPPTSPMTKARDTATEMREKRLAQRLDAVVRDADLERLDLPPQATASVARPRPTRAELALLSDHLLGLVERAGLLDALKALLINDALARRDFPLLKALGADRAPHSTTWVLPGQTPLLADPEGSGRAVARRLLATLAADQEREADEADADHNTSNTED